MADAKLLCAYLVVGADAHKREHAFERMQRRIADGGELAFDEEVFAGGAVEGDDVVASCVTLPVLCPRRLVVVREADKLSKQAVDAIVAYLDSPCDTTVLYLEADKLAKNTRLYKSVAAVGRAAGASSVVDCAPKRARELPETVRAFAASRHASIDADAARLLIDFVGEDTVRLDAEVERLTAVLGAGAHITVDVVRREVAPSAEPKPWLLGDALAARDARRCMQLLSRMPSQSPYGLLPRCTSTVRELIIAKEMEGAPLAALASELGKSEWMVKSHPANARRWSASELEGALVSAAATEAAMKGGTDPQAAFERWLLSVCAAG